MQIILNKTWFQLFPITIQENLKNWVARQFESYNGNLGYKLEVFSRKKKSWKTKYSRNNPL